MKKTPSLSEMQPRSVPRLQQLALMRLQLRFTAETHKLYRALYRDLVKLVKAAVDDDGVVDGVKLQTSMGTVDGHWSAMHRRWVQMFERARQAAADIPFGAMIVTHNAMMPVTEVTEALTDAEQAIARMWEARRQRALDTASQRIYSDGFNLSQRVWRLEQDGLQDIRRTLATALTERTSASRLARTLEPLLGAGNNCPRWAYSRLYKMTPGERATDSSGLLRGDECNSTGLAYNALRMARNEIQIAHHAVNDELFRVSPWVTGEKIRTSPGHAEVDICDEYASGGPYQPGEVTLPLHVQCVTPGQLVQTMRGAVHVETVRAGDYVLTHKGRYCLVTAAWGSSHNDQVYEVETEAGKFELTGNHPVLLTRGWVNAQDLQLGDHVLYAACGVLPDLACVVAEDMPTLTGKPSITSGVFSGSAFVPSNAVNFNGNLASNEGKVKEVSPNLELAFVDQTGSVQGVNHGQLCAGGVFVPPLSQSQEHGQQAGVVGFLGGGELAAHVGPLGDNAAFTNKPLAGDAHLGGSSNTAAAIVTSPLNGNGFAACAEWDIAKLQEVTENAIGDTVLPENLRGGQVLNDVDVVQQLGKGALVFGFKSQGMELCGGQRMGFEMGRGDAPQAQATDGARNEHDNLLLLSPEKRWGAGSGNPDVRGVANPSQALLDYSTIKAIRTRQYTGMVYNMTVEGDNSYTVNGAVVHNCMCYKQAVTMPAGAFRDQVRGWMRGENDFLDGYASWLGQTPTVNLSFGLAETFESWLESNPDAHAAGLGVVTP